MTPLDEVDRYVRQHHHVRRSFVRAVLEGRHGGRRGLRRWAIQKFHQVYEQNRVFSAIHANCPFEDVRQFMVEQLIAEETGITAGSASHYELMRRFANAMGAAPEEIAASRPDPEVRRFVEFMLEMARNDAFVDGMLPIYINESQAKDSAAALYTYLHENLNVSEHDLEWFAVHGEVDHEHAARARALMQKYTASDAGFRDRAMRIAERACAEWLLLHEHYAALLDDADNDRHIQTAMAAAFG
jgi:pyrroloquinoline-quinone synthase